MSQLDKVVPSLRDRVLKETCGEVQYNRKGIRRCLICGVRFQARPGNYWCNGCFVIVESKYKHNDSEIQQEIARATSSFDLEVIDERGDTTSFRQLAKKYRNELVRRKGYGW